MLKDALEFLKNSAAKEFYPRVITPAAEPKQAYLLAKEDGTYERMVAMPHPRQHKANDIESLIRALVDCSKIGLQMFSADGAQMPSKSSVWYDQDGIVGLFSDATRYDRVSMDLGVSPQIESLQKLVDTEPTMDQRKLIRFLKHEMSGCLGPTGKLLDVIRAVKFTNNQSGESARTQGKASIGNRIEAELTGVGALPEYVTFAVPTFANPRFSSVQDIVCSLDVDPVTGQFQLIPVPMAIENAISLALTIVGEAIDSTIAEMGKPEDFVVLCGSPEE